MELVTNKGVVVDIRRLDDEQGYDIGSYTMDVIEAWVDGEPAGYLQLMYLDQKTWDKQFSTEWDYATSDKFGDYKDLRAIDALAPDQRSPDQWKKLLSAGRYSLTPERKDALARADVNELEAQWTQRRAEICEDVRIDWLQTRSDDLNKPKVFYSHVYDKTTTARMVDGTKVERSGPDFRKQGIGTLMYEAAAVWMHEKGMNVWAGYSQTPGAKGAWRKLDERYDVGAVTAPHHGRTITRKYLDGSQVQLMGPQGPVLSQVGSETAGEHRVEADGPQITTTVYDYLHPEM